MDRVEYEHEVSRAELLGIQPPSWEEFSEQQKNKPPQEIIDDEKLVSDQQETTLVSTYLNLYS